MNNTHYETNFARTLEKHRRLVRAAYKQGLADAGLKLTPAQAQERWSECAKLKAKLQILREGVFGQGHIELDEE